MRIGTVKGSKIGNAYKSTKQVVILQVQLTNDDDVATVQHFLGPGVDATPPDGSAIVFDDSMRALELSLGGSDLVTPTSKAGEYEIYSSDGSAKKARAKAKSNGKLFLTSSVGGDLRTALEQLYTALSAFAGACTASTTDPTLVAAAGTLQTAVGTAKTALEGVLDNVE